MKTAIENLAWFALLSAFSLQPATFLRAAPLGSAFTYQGQLQRSDSPANGSYDFLFRLYDAPTNGSQIGPLITADAVPVSEGLFVVQLDFGAEAFNRQARWVQISVQTNGASRFTTLSPRQAILPAPMAHYAVGADSAAHAAYAANAGGVAGSNLIASADSLLTLRAPSIAIESDRFTNMVGGSASQVIGANSDVVVGGQMTVSAAGNYERTIGGEVTETLAKDFTTVVGVNHALSVGGNMALSVHNALTATCGKTATIDVGTDLLLQAANEVWLKTGESSMVMKKDGTITIAGKDISIKGSGEIVAKGSPAFRSAATETNETVIGILGESAATNGIGVLGIATSTTDDDVHAGVLAVADAGNKRIALLANCVTNDLLPATAIPRPAAIAGYALANQDLLQGYGKNHGLKFRVSDGGVVTAAAFEGDGASLTGIGAEALADNSVNAAKIVDGSVANADLADDAITSAKIADGTLAPGDLSPALASNTFWRLGGNSGNTPATHFLGTTDNQALEFKVNGLRALRLEPAAESPNVIAGHPGNAVTPGINGAVIGGGGNLDEPNAIMSRFGTISGGAGNFIQTNATSATIGGGSANVIGTNAIGATIPGGRMALADRYGQWAYASGRFQATGDAQSGLYVLRGTTSGQVTNELFLDGGKARLTLQPESTVTFHIQVAARGDLGVSAGYEFSGVISRSAAGTTAFVGTVDTSMTKEGATALNFLVEADNTHDALILKAVGAVSAYRWVATVRTTEVRW